MVKVYKGKYFKPDKLFTRSRNKIIVFDLDETLGQFAELHIVYKCLTKILDRELSQGEFNKLFDMFPEFVRPGIITILEFLYHKKQQGAFSRLFLYTNNQCGRNWVKFIINFFHVKIKVVDKPLFEDPICAFKIRNKIVNIRRTSQDKSYSDLVQCAMFPPSTTEVCFIDNTYYEHMCDDRVYYILPKSYHHSLTKIEIIRRMGELDMLSSQNHVKFMDLLSSSLGENTHPVFSLEIEMDITRKIMFHVREFLYFGSEAPAYRIKPATKTAIRKRGNKSVRKTRKNMEFV